MLNLNKRLAKFSFYWENSSEFHAMVYSCLSWPTLDFTSVPEGKKLAIYRSEVEKVNQKYTDLQISSSELIFILYGLFFNQQKKISQKGFLTPQEVQICNRTGLDLGLQGMISELRKKRTTIGFSLNNQNYDGYNNPKLKKFINNNSSLLWNIGFRNYHEVFAYFSGLHGEIGKPLISTQRQKLLNLAGHDIFHSEKV